VLGALELAAETADADRLAGDLCDVESAVRFEQLGARSSIDSMRRRRTASLGIVRP
jgi:hypothetical protein